MINRVRVITSSKTYDKLDIVAKALYILIKDNKGGTTYITRGKLARAIYMELGVSEKLRKISSLAQGILEALVDVGQVKIFRKSARGTIYVIDSSSSIWKLIKECRESEVKCIEKLKNFLAKVIET